MKNVEWHRPDRPPKEGRQSKSMQKTRLFSWLFKSWETSGRVVFGSFPRTEPRVIDVLRPYDGLVVDVLNASFGCCFLIWRLKRAWTARQKPGAIGRFAAAFDCLADAKKLPL